MPSRLRLWDIKLSDLPNVLGYCQSDTARIAQAVNAIQERLLFCREAGDEGWFGTFAEMAFTVTRDQPYLTLPREVARLELVDICDRPRTVNNQFKEYLLFGNGRLPKTFNRRCREWDMLTQVYSRNIVPTFTDLTNAPQLLRVYLTDQADFGKKVLLQGADNNGNTIYSQFGESQVTGEYVYLRSPFSTSVNQFNTITGIQKDMTAGTVQIFQVDPATGAQVLLLTMEPSETTAAYRRYLFNPIPISCCSPVTSATPQMISVTAIVKLELLPVQVDQDYLLIQSVEAMVYEAQALRYSKVDNKASQALAINAHTQAVRLLAGQLGHYLGIKDPAVEFAPFGSARLWKVGVGRLM